MREPVWVLAGFDFHRLPAEVQVAALEWATNATNGRGAFTVEMHILEEGLTRLMVMTRGLHAVQWCNCLPCHSPVPADGQRAGSTCRTFIRRAFYTTEPPPPELVRAAMEASERPPA